MRRPLFYTLIGHDPVPCANFHEWVKLFEYNTRVVAQTTFPDGVRVSTVFLGADLGFDEGEPILFETMVFGGALDQYQQRYETWDQAEAGHAEAVEAVKAGKEWGYQGW